MKELHWLEIGELSKLLERGDVSPVEVTRAQLDRIDTLDPALHAYVHVTADGALTAARNAEREILAGRRRGPLHGIPVGLKDLFWTQDAPAAGGSVIHRDFQPQRDGTAVHRLRKAGAVFLGKLQMTEGAYSDHHPSVTPPVNPWNANYWTGISSSGPGTAVAAGMCYGALASDTGGSIRWPCGANGLSGIKPTWGRVSRDGMWALAPTMDHVGTMARSVSDAALLLHAMAGPDPLDPTALQNSASELGLVTSGLRVGVDARWNEEVEEPVRSVIEAATETFRGLGATIVEVAAPDRTVAPQDWPDLCAVEAAVAHADTYPSRADDYGPVLAAVIDRGRSLSAMDHQMLALRRLRYRGEFDALFIDVDVLLCPVQPFAPLTLARLGTMGERPDLIAQLQQYTSPFNLTGAPTVTLPGGFDDAGMPINFQLAAAPLRDMIAINAGLHFQRATTWHTRHPSP